MPMSDTPRFAAGLKDLVAHYDLFLLDQYGVLHDGEAPYPGVPESLAYLRESGKGICVLTNSGRSAAHNQRRLTRLGLEAGLFDRVVTSGDMALDYLVRERPGDLCYPLCSARVAAGLPEAGLRLAESPEEADLLLLNTLPLPPDEMTEEVMAPAFEVGLRHGLPLICSNPDMVGPQGARVVLSPGTVAGWYRAGGGQVRSFGKPDPAFLRYALSLFPDMAAARSIMIGDTPETDLAGARAAGIDAAFVTGGVHAEKFASLAPDARRATAESLLRAAETEATWVIPGLAWEEASGKDPA